MDLFTSLKTLAERVKFLKDKVETEEATKRAFIDPFFKLLGYDFADPTEVVPEYNSDFGSRQGAKVDYAIIRDDKPIILIECKPWKEKLSENYASQLMKYYSASDAKFTILTNGIEYKFFTDLEKANVMDKFPYLEFDIEHINESIVVELEKFKKATFDEEKIIETATELKYLTATIGLLKKEFANPSKDFVKYIGKSVYDGNLTSNRLENFTEIVKRACDSMINSLVDKRLQDFQEIRKTEIEIEIQKNEADKKEDSKIVTTQEEDDAYHILKSIIRNECDLTKFKPKDNQTYFSTYYEKQTQPVCRLYFNNQNKKYISILDATKNEEKILIEKLDDIYNYSEKIIASIKSYL
nr:type I restriction enzyme HsdR N-terminal domain-containing protein [Bacteroidota bacterium]